MRHLNPPTPHSFIQMEISDAGVQGKQSSPLLKVLESHKSVKEYMKSKKTWVN